MGAIIVLLLLGTQLLDWRWLVPIPLATLVLGIYATWRALPSSYGVAKIVDHRLGLADTLSTAFFFGAMPPEKQAGEPMIAPQLRHADRLAGTVAVKEAVPFTLPRALYLAAVLLCVASSLFALRYGLERRLDLKSPLARVIQHALGFETKPEVESAKRKTPPNKRPDLKDMEALSIPDANQGPPAELDAAPDSALDTVDVPDTDVKKAEAQSKTKQADSGEKAEGEGESSEEASNAGEGNDAGKEGQQGAGKKSGESKQASGNQQGGSQGNNSSLLAKFRDAMQNLMSRMKQQPSGTGSQMQQTAAQNGKQGQSQASKGGQKGGKNQSGQQSDGDDSQAGEESQSAQNATGRGSGQEGEEQSSKQPGSGIGKSDGSKDVQLAEQLAAMGKISEIIGKRSQNVSGEVTIEVQSSSQQLSTPWVRSGATHGDAGGEISRDEVPVALQTFVQQYFEQVRKQAGSKDSQTKTRGN